jgi:DNA-directed RNA polymerase subunit RPC12/RpoP
MRMKTRLQKLECSRTFAVCPACRHRRIIVMRTGTQQADGTMV